MKRRRGAVVTCDDCNKDFESQDSAQLHFLSRSHLQRLLAIKNVPLMGSAEVNENDAENDEENGEQWGEFPANITSSNSSYDEIPDHEDGRLMEEDFNCEQEQFAAAEPHNDDFFPFPNEKFFLLYCYAHSVMRPKSRSDLEFLWTMLERFGVQLPSLSSVLSFKVDGMEDCLPLKKSYGDGHPFYWIAPSDIIKLQLATPSVASKIVRYPEKTDRFITELYQGRRWCIEDKFQTTSANIDGLTVYVKDVVTYKMGETICHGKVNGFYMKNIDNSLVHFCEITKAFAYGYQSLVLTQQVEEIPIVSINGLSGNRITFKEINDEVIQLTMEEVDEMERPHPTKVAAGGKQTLTLPIVIFSDETSGNRSKKWNRLESYSMFLASLPRKEISKFSNIHFISASNLVNSADLGKEIATDLKALEDGMPMFDINSNCDVFIQCPVLFVGCDNPRASEFCHHMGSSANYFCRICEATKETATEIGNVRTKQGIQTTLGQINTANSEAQKKRIRTATGITERGGQFDALSVFEATRQTPVEVLHTILLGPVKYLVKKTITNLSAADKKKVKAKIEAFDFSAYARRLPSSFVKIYGSCVGRDFKLWAQISVFILDGIIPEDELEVWLYISEMFAMAYGSEVDIEDMDNITNLMEQTIECISEVHPEFMQKQKFHMLLHLKDDMLNYGPPIGFCTERFEAFNSIIRQLNVYSNRHASSKDIGEKFAKHHLLKFLINGGYWKDGDIRRCASKELIRISQQPAFQKFMYQIDPKATQLMDKEIYQPGSLRLGNYKNGRITIVNTADILPTTQAVQDDINTQNVNIQPKCKEFKACVAQDKTLVHKGNVFAYNNHNNEACFGKFCTSVQFSSDDATENWVLLAELKMLRDDANNVVHGKFTSPLLEEKEIKRLIPATALLQKVSVVHNCDYRCGFVDAELPVVEEREINNKERYIFEHDLSNKLYVLNRFYLGESWKYIPDE